MGTRAVIALGDRFDVWIEEEALVFEDRVAPAAEVTPVATTIAGRFRRPPLGRVGRDAAQAWTPTLLPADPFAIRPLGGHCELRGRTALSARRNSEEAQMKYVISSTTRLNGSAKENDADMRRGLELFSKWTPPASTTFHQFVGRVDGGGVFAVVETDNPADLLDTVSKFVPILEYEIHPVVEIADWARILQEGAEFRESVS